MASLNGDPMEALVWNRHQREWGPIRWPVFWCDILEKRELDCGVFQALAMEALSAQGIQAIPVQAIFEYDLERVNQWRAMWGKAGLDYASWIDGTFVYHEIVALARDDGDNAFFDPSDLVWIRPGFRGGGGVLRALRSASSMAGVFAQLNEAQLAPGEWKLL